MTNICQSCGKQFNASPSAHRKYCSCNCYWKILTNKLKPNLHGGIRISVCQICGKKIINFKCRNSKYCSRKCFYKYLAKHLKKRIGPLNPMWKSIKDKSKICEYCGKTFQYKNKKQRFCSIKCMGKARIGPDNPSWNGGSESRTPYAFKYKIWRETVLKRDNYQCQKCDSKINLHVHHIKNWAQYPNLRFDISNGLTLCKNCHYITFRKL